MSDLQSKTDEELNVMLAELVGYRLEKFTKVWESVMSPQDRIRLLRPDGSEVTWFHDIGLPFELVMYDGHLPNFCSSLDEVAKVEAGLTDEQKAEYAERYLPFYSGAETREQGPIDFWKLATASARQRTIALIQTLQQ